MKRIAVLSHIVLDEVHAAGIGTDAAPSTEIGGAGAYAATGASLAGSHGSAVLVSGVGSNDRARLTGWCERREIDASGLFAVSEHSPRTVIRYFSDGEREETPLHGLAHFDAHTPLPRHIPFPPERIDGVYLFHDHDAAYWEEVAACRALFAAPFLWEISADSCRREALAEVRERIELVDVLSINRTEAVGLFGVERLDEAIGELERLPVTTVLRLGAEGSMVIDGDTTWVGVAEGAAIDPTGGGNGYSGAFLAAFASSGDAVPAARTAAAAAAEVIAQPGAPLVDDHARARIRARAIRIPIERRTPR